MTPFLKQYLILTTLQVRQSEKKPTKPELVKLAAIRAQNELNRLNLDKWTDSSLRAYLLWEVIEMPVLTRGRVAGEAS
jgi:hypothetical protein